MRRRRPLLLALLALACLPAAARADSWGPAAAMPSERGGQSAVLLPNGKVLVTAGDGLAGSLLASAIVYDPAANAWLGAPDMPAPGRDNQAASLLKNGQVLVTGGVIPGSPSLATNGAVTFNSPVNLWRSFTPPMPTAHAAHTQTTLADGRALVVGGYASGTDLSDLSGQGTAAVELYDPASDRWTSAASLPVARGRHTATLLQDGTVLVAGGSHTDTLASAVRYDPDSDSWSSAGTMSTARREFTATLLPDGRVLVAGGVGARDPRSGNRLATSSAELYDPDTNRWSPAASMSTPRVGHTATLLPNGKVLVVGGGGVGDQASAELYDPATDSWSSAHSMVVARSNHTATLLPDGRVLVAGGFGNTGAVASAEIYTPDPPAGGGGQGGGGGGGQGGGGGTPAISKLALSATRFRAASSGPSVTAARRRRAPIGTTITYRDGAAATSTFAVQKPAAGRKASGRCVKPNRRNRHGRACTRWVTIGRFTHADTAGANSLHFSGRLNGHKLRPGSYRLSVSARVGRGRATAAKTIGFRIVG